MGFADKLVRFVRGEPLYQPDDVSAEEQQQNAAVTPGTSPVAVVPIVTIRNVKNVATNNGTQVYATLQNESGETVQLHEVEVLGKTIKLELPLMAKEAKQDIVVYAGDAITSSNVGSALLRYRSSQQDTPYKAIYALEARTVDVGRLGITDFHLQLPVSTE